MSAQRVDTTAKKPTALEWSTLLGLLLIVVCAPISAYQHLGIFGCGAVIGLDLLLVVLIFGRS